MTEFLTLANLHLHHTHVWSRDTSLQCKWSVLVGKDKHSIGKGKQMNKTKKPHTKEAMDQGSGSGGKDRDKSVH